MPVNLRPDKASVLRDIPQKGNNFFLRKKRSAEI